MSEVGNPGSNECESPFGRASSPSELGSPPELIEDDGSDSEGYSNLGGPPYAMQSLHSGGVGSSRHDREELLRSSLTEAPQGIEQLGGRGSGRFGGTGSLLIVSAESNEEAASRITKGLIPWQPLIRLSGTQNSILEESGGPDTHLDLMAGVAFIAEQHSQEHRDSSNESAQYTCHIMPALWVQCSPDSVNQARTTLESIADKVNESPEPGGPAIQRSLSEAPPDLASYANHVRDWLLPLLSQADFPEMTFRSEPTRTGPGSQGRQAVKAMLVAFQAHSKCGIAELPNLSD